MKFHLRTTAIAVALLAGVSVAAAQTSTTEAKLQLSQAQKAEIYQSLSTGMERNSTASPAPGAGVNVRVGAALPANVKLLDVPQATVAQVPAMSSYKYAMFGDEIVIVDPGSREIVEILRQ